MMVIKNRGRGKEGSSLHSCCSWLGHMRRKFKHKTIIIFLLYEKILMLELKSNNDKLRSGFANTLSYNLKKVVCTRWLQRNITCSLFANRNGCIRQKWDTLETILFDELLLPKPSNLVRFYDPL